MNIHQRSHCDFHFGHDFRLPCHRKSPKVMATAAAFEGGSAESAKWVGLNTGHEPNLWPFVNTSIMITVITGKLCYTAPQVWTISNHVLSHYHPMFSPLKKRVLPMVFPNFPTPGVPNSYTKDQFPKRPPSPKPGEIFDTQSLLG